MIYCAWFNEISQIFLKEAGDNLINVHNPVITKLFRHMYNRQNLVKSRIENAGKNYCWVNHNRNLSRYHVFLNKWKSTKSYDLIYIKVIIYNILILKGRQTTVLEKYVYRNLSSGQ